MAIGIDIPSITPPGPNRLGAAPTLAQLAALGRSPDLGDPAVAPQMSAKMLSALFFAPMLAELRKLPFGKDLFDGGRTEEIFGEELDNRIADAIAQADPGGITAALAEQFRPRSDGAGSPPAAGGSPVPAGRAGGGASPGSPPAWQSVIKRAYAGGEQRGSAAAGRLFDRLAGAASARENAPAQPEMAVRKS